MTKYALLAAALTIVPTSAWGAELVANGGFESPVISGPCCNTAPPDPLPGWTATPNVNVVNGTFSSAAGNLAFQGSQYLDLVGQGGTGSITQSFATIAGQMYTLTFAYSHNLFTPTVTSASASFSVDGLSGVIVHNSGSNTDLDWQIFTNSFLATSNSATLTFTNLTGGVNEGVFLDGVSVTGPIPEPSTWAMLLVGFGMLGGAFRASRRRKLHAHALA